MEYKVGDRVIRTYPNGTIKKGIIKEFETNLCVKFKLAESLDNGIVWAINKEITRDIQYYREERLKQLLG